MKDHKYNLTFGRKFVGMLLGIVVLAGGFVFAGVTMPEAINASVVITFFFLVTLLIMSYIGGNIYNNFIKSKFFSGHRYDGEEK